MFGNQVQPASTRAMPTAQMLARICVRPQLPLPNNGWKLYHRRAPPRRCHIAMSTPQDLKTAGLKATLPRLKIINLFEQSTVRHLTAEDVYRQLLAEIGRASCRERV